MVTSRPQRLLPVAERLRFAAMIAPFLRLVLGGNEMPSIGTWFRLAAKAAFAFGLGIGPSQTADALYDVKPGARAKPAPASNRRARRARRRARAHRTASRCGPAQGGDASLYTRKSLRQATRPSSSSWRRGGGAGRPISPSCSMPTEHIDRQGADRDDDYRGRSSTTCRSGPGRARRHGVPIKRWRMTASSRSEFAAIEKAAKPLRRSSSSKPIRPRSNRGAE